MSNYRLLASLSIAPFLIFIVVCTHPAEVCDKEESRLSWVDEAPDGTTPQQRIAHLEGEYLVQGVDTADESEQEFAIGLWREDRDIEYLRRTDSDSGENSDFCTDRMDLPMRLTVSSQDNQFAENFELIVRRTETGHHDSLRLVHSFSPEDLNGSWQPEVPEGREIDRLRIIARFSEDSVSAEVDVISVVAGEDGTESYTAFVIGGEEGE